MGYFLRNCEVHIRGRSLFSALTGLENSRGGDVDIFDMSNPKDAIENARNHAAHVDFNSIPLIPTFYTNANSYMLDIYLHEMLKYATTDNGLSRPEAWAGIKDMHDQLKMILHCIEKMLGIERDAGNAVVKVRGKDVTTVDVDAVLLSQSYIKYNSSGMPTPSKLENKFAASGVPPVLRPLTDVVWIAMIRLEADLGAFLVRAD